MNNVSNSASAFEIFQKCACRMIQQCYTCFNCARRRRIHPDNSSNPNHNKIIRFHASKLIRVIHLKNFINKKSNFVESPLHFSDHSDERKRTFSFSDSDYAFTCWSKPLRLCDECRRSFKNLWQENMVNSVPSQCLENDNTQPEHSFSSRQVTLNNSLEEFADAFVTGILNDAISNICSKKTLQNSFSSTSESVLYAKSREHKFELGNSRQCKSEHEEKTDESNIGCILELGPCPEQSILQKNKPLKTNMNGIMSDCSCGKEDTPENQSNGEMYVYYNSSYSDAEEEPNIRLKLGEKNSVTQNGNFSICPHLKNKSSKPILLFLHGVGCSADLWSHLLYYFGEEGYEVVAPDMLGHGFSSTPDSPCAYTFHNLLKDTLDIFDKFVGEMKCVVIGHAFGCSLAAALARYRPQQVSQLVLVSGGGPTPLAPRTADFRPPAVSPWLQICLKPLLFCGLKRDILYVPCGKHIETADSIKAGVPSYVLNHIARGQDWPEGDSAFHRRILVPTLLVHGMKDPYVTLVQECEMERTIPRSSLELIANAGHFAMLETPEKLCHMIQCFINWWNL
ncbi:Uncharacterized protein GBIM_18807 [Gryllus bimaculatus]|nr:Uncharacterized protein GBIM_18807 [Gryllus bimaculatus]